MKHHLPPLDALKVFESAARQLSFSLAARELCITKGAVSYQIRRLEEGLDCALFRRAVRQVYLTNAGQQLLQTTQRLFAQLTSTLQKISPGDSAHDVLVGATTYVALRWLSPRISGFSERNPEISILLQHSVNAEDFSIQEVDFAIRWCRMEGLKDRHRVLELPMPLFPVCSPNLLQHYVELPANTKLKQKALSCPPLKSIPLLCEDRPLDLWQTWYGQQEQPLSNPRRIIADANVRTQAAVDGQGWTMADALMQRELDAGALVAPFRHRLEGYGYAIQTSAGRYVSQKALELRQWLVDNA
jgi:LysR family glycine cleavage system transcriptional activator